MARTKAPEIGTITWRDLTVKDATKLRDFYSRVVGWKTSEVKMGDYSDYCMHVPTSDEVVAGVCHARGHNANLPPQWLMYITVKDVDRSAARCKKLGGKVLVKPRPMAGGRFCVIRDPAGAVCALYRPPR